MELYSRENFAYGEGYSHCNQEHLIVTRKTIKEENLDMLGWEENNDKAKGCSENYKTELGDINYSLEAPIRCQFKGQKTTDYVLHSF